MGNLSTPDSVQKLQTALHAKAKAEPGYRFYALYDKLARADILAHAYAQCRSNKGAPGVDRQDFEAVEASRREFLSLVETGRIHRYAVMKNRSDLSFIWWRKGRSRLCDAKRPSKLNDRPYPVRSGAAGGLLRLERHPCVALNLN